MRYSTRASSSPRCSYGGRCCGPARGAIAGVVVNTPDNLMRWIEHPQAMAPRTAMPELGVTREQARDIAACLYSK